MSVTMRKLAAPWVGDVGARRQEGREQLGHVGGRHEVHRQDLKHRLALGGRGGGCRVAPDVQGQLLGIGAGRMR